MPKGEERVDEVNEVSELRALLEQTRQELEGLKGKQSRFVRQAAMDRPKRGGYEPPEKLRSKMLRSLGVGEQGQVRTGLYDDPKHLQSLPPEYRPAFHAGDIVRLDPESKVYGSDQATWGAVLAERNMTEAEGEVIGVQYITKTFEPKYKVYFPGLTTRNGDGFRESELLPA